MSATAAHVEPPPPRSVSRSSSWPARSAERRSRRGEPPTTSLTKPRIMTPASDGRRRDVRRARRACRRSGCSASPCSGSRSRAGEPRRSTTCSIATSTCSWDREPSDARSRPGRVTPAQALEFGIVLSAASFALLASAVNVLTAVLALVGNLFYVLVYTRWLKRSTPQNIVIGGAAGAVPPLVGYAAATGSLALPALWLFLIVFLWTPPHFWALALMIKNAYATAGVPMLPVVRGDRETARQIVLYSLAMVAFTVVGDLARASTRSRRSCSERCSSRSALLLRRDPRRARAQVLFHYSLLYLALLFTAAALDPVLVLMDPELSPEPLRLGALPPLLAALRRHVRRRRAAPATD